MPFNIEKVIRPNILGLKPYRCARDDYSSGVLLDANENAFGTSLNSDVDDGSMDLHRYPDPHQIKVKQSLIQWRGVESTDNVFIGVGSDEVIDLVMRVSCVPGKDKILITPPTYGMYSVCADINDVSVIKSNLIVKDGKFQLDTEDMETKLRENPDIKIVFLCSPGNPTGTCLQHKDMQAILESSYEGLVVVDEAYIDFVEHESKASVATWVKKYPNLIVMQTLSKSFGLAGIRLGIAIADTKIIEILNKTKAPYNVGTPSSRIAEEALSDKGLKKMEENKEKLIEQRGKLIEKLEELSEQGVGPILGGNDANFVLVQINDKGGKACNKRAESVYSSMANASANNVVVRFRGKEYGCAGCLRITVGTEEENYTLMRQLKETLEKYDSNITS